VLSADDELSSEAEYGADEYTLETSAAENGPADDQYGLEWKAAEAIYAVGSMMTAMLRFSIASASG
jgi:hypothetical protein